MMSNILQCLGQSSTMRGHPSQIGMNAELEKLCPLFAHQPLLILVMFSFEKSHYKKKKKERKITLSKTFYFFFLCVL